MSAQLGNQGKEILVESNTIDSFSLARSEVGFYIPRLYKGHKRISQ